MMPSKDPRMTEIEDVVYLSLRKHEGGVTLRTRIKDGAPYRLLVFRHDGSVRFITEGMKIRKNHLRSDGIETQDLFPPTGRDTKYIIET